MTDCELLPGYEFKPVDHQGENAPAHPDQGLAARRDAARALEDLLAGAEDDERRAGASTDPEEWFGAQSESLLHWARERGRFISPPEYDALTKGCELLNGELEHLVMGNNKGSLKYACLR